jgi:putative ABC transport system ATP-binding protein
MEMLRDLARKRRRAVVVVTHDNRVLEFADRIVHIEDGRLMENTTPDIAHLSRDLLQNGEHFSSLSA